MQNDPVNFVDPTGLVESWNCYVDGVPMSNCGIAFGLVNAGAAYIYIPGGTGFFGDILVTDKSSINGEGDIELRQWVYFDPGQDKEPCPPVPETPPGVSLDENIKTAERHRPNGPFTAYNDAKWFKSMVTHKAPWDYKRIDIKYEDFGNFNLGATGTAIGFSLVQLLSEAGKLQAVPKGMKEKPKEWGYPAGWLFGKGKYPYGDEPKDAIQVEAGRNYYIRKFVRKDCK